MSKKRRKHTDKEKKEKKCQKASIQRENDLRVGKVKAEKKKRSVNFGIFITFLKTSFWFALSLVIICHYLLPFFILLRVRKNITIVV